MELAGGIAPAGSVAPARAEAIASGLAGDVTIVFWPEEEARRQELTRAGCARLLLVATDAPPPDVDDELEDWVRLPADGREIVVRARRLSALAAETGAEAPDA